jgi:DNA-binding Lrp family transcriptional regulator
MNKNIFYINEADKEKSLNFNNSDSFDSKKIGLILSNNPQVLIKHWIKFQQEWVSNIYKKFHDHDKYIILMFLMSKTWQDNSELFKFNSIDEHYSQSTINLPDVSLSEISKSLKIPKETIRRKLVELEKENIIKREGQKIILAQLALSLQKPETSIKKLSIFFEKLSILLSAQDWFGPAISREDIELFFNKYYTVFWNRFFKMQIPFLIRWKTVFGDLESWVIWANMGINQSSNLEKISTNSKKKFSLSEVKSGKFYIDNIQENEPTQGVNASSIADISGIPRATVLRKLKKLSSEKVIKRNKKLEYVLSSKGKLNERIKVNYLLNQQSISVFVTDIFNLIKKSRLKI